MEHAHEEQYFRKLVGLIIKIIFDLKVFFFYNIILKRGLTLEWAWSQLPINLQVYMCTLSLEMETEYLAHMSYSGNQTILGWSVDTIWLSGYKKMLQLVFKIITQKKHVHYSKMGQ